MQYIQGKKETSRGKIDGNVRLQVGVCLPSEITSYKWKLAQEGVGNESIFPSMLVFSVRSIYFREHPQT